MQESIETTHTKLEDRLRFETLLAETSSRFVNVPADQVDGEIEGTQRRMSELLDDNLYGACGPCFRPLFSQSKKVLVGKNRTSLQISGGKPSPPLFCFFNGIGTTYVAG